MTNREWLGLLPKKELYKAAADWIVGCRFCAYHRDRGCTASAGETCMGGKLKWLEEEYCPGQKLGLRWKA